ncbi:hypothetical protein [Nonomuraea sp. NPDC049625]|uniref:hypothetical protein n=1 Tax=Nonomuraea sp. NPDC049625 TaxID=3155775 RepID=UPI00343702A8
MAMTLDGQGRPMIAWVDDAGLFNRNNWALKVTTVLNAGQRESNARPGVSARDTFP